MTIYLFVILVFGVDYVYQSYSFNKGYQIIYVYDAKLDNNKNPTKNFGRLIARLSMIWLGELESLSFRGGYVYIGFGNYGYDFYKIDINKFFKGIINIIIHKKILLLKEMKNIFYFFKNNI